MKCPNCGAEVTGNFCEYCGSEMPKEKSITNINNKSKTIINNYYTNGNVLSQKNLNNVTAPKTEKKKKSTYHYTGPGVTILWLIFFFPVGLIRMWVKKDFPKAVRIAITVFIILIIIASAASPKSDTNTNTNTNTVIESAPSFSPTPTATQKEYDSLEDAFKEGFEDGLGDSADERKESVDESIESIKESIEYIFSE